MRLRYAYFITCREVVKDAAGEVVELRCTYDPATRGGNTPPDGRKVQATLHWVAAADAVPGRGPALSTRCSRGPTPTRRNFAADLNPNSLEVLTGCRLEPAIAAANDARADPVRAAGLLLARSRLRRRAASSSTAPSVSATATPRLPPRGSVAGRAYCSAGHSRRSLHSDEEVCGSPGPGSRELGGARIDAGVSADFNAAQKRKCRRR